ncbi:MAG: hypothetical protein COV75_02730 [Candidatus Omnitrophica bacterium CG11_big_fil_rev_8_21_14_0_20_63_9]|nr:MAG: hypothetical protein COV75_02730 [Candidatus Omnitrophica bacterium CG11_big_fil_rev_8_21_14_0_20_63_9]
MSFERILEGTVEFIDRQNRTLRVKQEIKKEGNRQPLSVVFSLAPNVTVTSSSRGILKLTELRIGQKVLVHYVTESGGKAVANTIAIVEPMSKPGSFSGVRVAG